MWFLILIFSPFIYLIVSNIVDAIQVKANTIKRDKYYGEEELTYFTTYNNDNITKEDLMLVFMSQFQKYRKRYYNISYRVFDKKEDQNNPWSIKTTKNTFGWGAFYNIRFSFSNGWVYLFFSDCDSRSSGLASLPYFLEYRDFGTPFIENTLEACKQEANIMWKVNGYNYADQLPFDYIPLLDRTSSNNRRTRQQKDENTQYDNVAQTGLLNFYRNLLGLKLRFSQDELKRAYHEAVVKFHPDRYGSSSARDRENAEMLMKQVNDAYERLKAIVS